jgi:transcription initiation factor IIE alpha subunit
MNVYEQSIPCPVCQTPIPFDTKLLISGVQFTCSNCQSSIGLDSGSRNVVADAMNKLEELKQASSTQKTSNQYQLPV